MLQDFITMLPELYGGKSCTANAHLLSHVSWGPLWTHSAFGFENYNGYLKYLFHSRGKIVDQLVFNIDVQQTLQLLQPCLLKYESTEVLEFFKVMRGNTLKSKYAKKLVNTLTSWGKRCKSIFLQRKVIFLASLMEHLQYSPDFTMMELSITLLCTSKERVSETIAGKQFIWNSSTINSIQQPNNMNTINCFIVFMLAILDICYINHKILSYISVHNL